MNLLSIQSHVVYGHVGNDAAVFPLQRLGIEVWPLHTVQFSNHTGYPAWKGAIFEARMIRDIVSGLAARDVLAACDGVLSGYVGSVETGEAILDAVAAVKEANPRARYCCDPVIGDVGRGVFVRDGIPEFFHDRALALADVTTPNHFELDRLAGAKAKNLKAALEAVDRLHARGPTVVLVTSLHTEDTPDNGIDLVASSADGKYRLRTPKLPIAANGAGDLTAALFFAHYLRTGSAAEALRLTGSSVFGVLNRTAMAGAQELALVAAQDEIVSPSRMFDVERL
ncbi:MAG: pyridoxal kinase PdxY [Pseudorhodoplanes sp.]